MPHVSSGLQPHLCSGPPWDRAEHARRGERDADQRADRQAVRVHRAEQGELEQ